jgi:hypothetical protein
MTTCQGSVQPADRYAGIKHFCQTDDHVTLADSDLGQYQTGAPQPIRVDLDGGCGQGRAMRSGRQMAPQELFGVRRQGYRLSVAIRRPCAPRV